MSFERPSKLKLVPETRNESVESCISEASFIEQLQRPCVLEKPNTETGESDNIEYRDITPERMERGECVVFVGGLGTTAVDYTEQLRVLAERGRRVVYCNPMRGIAPSEELAAYAHEKGLPPLMAYKASEVLYLMEHLGIKRADIIGHSQGGAVSTLVAAFHPESIGQLILDTPAGLVEEKSRDELAKLVVEEFHAEEKFVTEKTEEGDPSYQEAFERNKAAMNKDKEYIAWRNKVEIPSIGQTSTLPLLEDLRACAERGDLVPEVTLVTAQDDRIFTPQEMEAALGDVTKGGAFVNRWVMYPDPKIGHGPVEHHQTLGADAAGRHNASVLADLLIERDSEKVEFKEAA